MSWRKRRNKTQRSALKTECHNRSQRRRASHISILFFFFFGFVRIMSCTKMEHLMRRAFFAPMYQFIIAIPSNSNWQNYFVFYVGCTRQNRPNWNQRMRFWRRQGQKCVASKVFEIRPKYMIQTENNSFSIDSVEQHKHKHTHDAPLHQEYEKRMRGIDAVCKHENE